MLQRFRTAGLSLCILALLLAGCKNNQPGTISTLVVTFPPTSTLAPLYTTTPRYTATLPPSDTPIPSPTVSPVSTDIPPTDVPTITLTPTPGIQGTVNSDATIRSGPARTFSPTGPRTVSKGTLLTVLGVSSDGKYYNVRLDDGTEGWIAQNLLDVPDSATLTVLDAAAQTQMAQTVPNLPGTPGQWVAYHDPFATAGDVLAYCDAKGRARKTISTATGVTIWWSWFAKTQDQIQAHLNSAQYEVKVDGKLLDNWQNLHTDIVRQQGRLYVYWFVPLTGDFLSSGEHPIDFKLTWKAPISDGDLDYGPGTKHETDTGTCAYTIK